MDKKDKIRELRKNNIMDKKDKIKGFTEKDIMERKLKIKEFVETKFGIDTSNIKEVISLLNYIDLELRKIINTFESIDVLPEKQQKTIMSLFDIYLFLEELLEEEKYLQ